MQIKERKELEVTVDKRHIISIGERLYTESVELLRELINHAYDADATEVHVEIVPDRITVRDNGSGMDAQGLRQYFIIGSGEKVVQSVSPKFGRERIGQFGIGKFASLSAASRFEVFTQHDDFAARVIFDKKTWEATKGTWYLPCEIMVPDRDGGDGTTVVLSELTKWPLRGRASFSRMRSPSSVLLSLSSLRINLGTGFISSTRSCFPMFPFS